MPVIEFPTGLTLNLTIIEICARRTCDVAGVVEYLVHYANSWLPEDDCRDIIQKDDREPIVEILFERCVRGEREMEQELLVSWKCAWIPVDKLDLTSQVVVNFIIQNECLRRKRELLPKYYPFVYKKHNNVRTCRR